jgi:hypothetical protein
MKRHGRENFFVVGEGVFSAKSLLNGAPERPSTLAEIRKFRFSRMGPQGESVDLAALKALAELMTADTTVHDSTPAIPAGFTYFGQFLDHDLTLDPTALKPDSEVIVADLLSGRSPALDLDSLYGQGPDSSDAKFYKDGVRFKLGTTAKTTFPDNGVNVDLDGFDLPRRGVGSLASERRLAEIPDIRNDENLAVGQLHLAMMRFHNRVADVLAVRGTPSKDLFNVARDLVTRHYQWVIRHDYLTKIIDPAIVSDVFTNGRRLFEPAPKPGDEATMPIEFSVAAFRLGHSMIRTSYEWNRVFNTTSGIPGTLDLLFRFSGTSGNLNPAGDVNDPNFDLPDNQDFERLPTNWIVDFKGLFDFSELPQARLPPPANGLNVTQIIDTRLVDPLAVLPVGSFGNRGQPPSDPAEFNLAFRNLVRGNMVRLASGQQMVVFAIANGVQATLLGADQILRGKGGIDLTGLSKPLQSALVSNTPLWFYILREAELNGGVLTGVGGRIVAEVFHRAMEVSEASIVRDPVWRPGMLPSPDNPNGVGQTDVFRMTDLLWVAFEGKDELLNPLG